MKNELSMDQARVLIAVQVAKRYHDITPITDEIEQQNPEILNNKEARDIILSAMKGEPWYEGGKPISKDKEKRDEEILVRLCQLKNEGWPIKNETTQEDAINIAAREFNTSRSTAYDAWRYFGKTLFGKSLKSHFIKKV